LQDWERKPVASVGNVVCEIVKVPEKRTSRKVQPSRLVLSIRRADAFRGIMLLSVDDLEDLRTLLQSEKLTELMKAIEEHATKTAKEIKFEL